MQINNQRPGVYSRYELSSDYATPRSLHAAAVVAKANGGIADTLYTFRSFAQAAEVFAPDTADTHMHTCIRLLFESGVSVVHAVAVGGGYASALACIEQVDGIGAVVCDAQETPELVTLRDSMLRSAQALRERVAYCGADDAQAAITTARALNSERVVLCAPPTEVAGAPRAAAVYVACLLAGQVLAKNDCAYNWNAAAFPTLSAVPRLPEEQLQDMIAAGVCVFEMVGGTVECVRAVTTRTKNGAVEDRSLHALNTILIIDSVMQGLRARLALQLRGTRVSAASLSSIASQVTIELAARQDEGVIESFQPPAVALDDADPSVCVVRLSFKVAHVVSQILVTAHIQV